MPGQRIGRYRVKRFLGAGAMGEIHLARDPALGRVVAIKLLKRDGGAVPDLDTEARLLREAQALARLSHPNVVPVYDVGLHAGRLFIAMEYVRGRTLREWLRARRRPWPEVLTVLIQAGRGLAAAHECDLVHRDFKPDNVLVDRTGRARVMDFGLARTIGHVEPHTNTLERTGDGLASDLTRTGWVVGTPRYMSPEQHAGAPVDARTDQFAFCVALFEALYEMRAFAGRDVTSMSEAKREGRIGNPVAGPRPDVARGMPPAIHSAIVRGLEPDPADRWPSMPALLDALEATRRPRGQAITRIGALAGAVIALVALASTSDPDPCALGVQRVDELWSADARAELGRTFRSSDTPFAEDGFSATTAAIDGWVERWRTARRGACLPEANEDARLDARLRCLDRGLQSLQASLDVLRRGTGRTLEHAVEVAHALPSVDACLEPATDTGPDDPTRRAAITRMQQRLGEVSAYLTAGLYGAAEATARLGLQDAQASTHAPAVAIARGTLGDVLGHRGDTEAGVRELGEAYWLAQETGEDETAARTATALVIRVGVDLGRPEEGLGWARHARAALSRTGERPLLHAQLLQNEALVLAALGRTHEAITAHDEVIALRRTHAPDRPLELALTHAAAADVLELAGRDAEGLEQRRNALALRESVLGSNHPLLGDSLVEVGDALRSVGDDAEAVRHIRRGLSILERAHGHDDTRLIAPLTSLAEAFARLQRHTESADALARALALSERRADLEHAELAALRFRLAQVEHAMGHADRATALLRAADEAAARARDTGLRERIAEALREWAFTVDIDPGADPTDALR